MKSKNLINEVRNLQKIAGLLKENEDFDLSYNPFSQQILEKPVVFYFGYDIENIQEVENYIQSNYNVITSQEDKDNKADAMMWLGYGDDTMNSLEVYSEKLLNDRTFQALISNCDGEGNFQEDDEEDDEEDD